MATTPTLIIYEEQVFTVGEDTFIDSTVANGNAVVFEDNCDTGYFYATNISTNMKILDGLHIYNVADVIDKHIPSTLKILWTEELEKAYLSINNYYHLVFDFHDCAGYCRNGFPEARNTWSKVKNRTLTETLIL